jgi:hypothetical protein
LGVRSMLCPGWAYIALTIISITKQLFNLIIKPP